MQATVVRGRVTWVAILIAAALAGGGGCVQSSTTPQHPHDTLRPGDLPAMTGQAGVTPGTLTSKDRCPDRLQAIAGALFEYYVDHRALPAKLDELQPYAPGVPMVCPDSNLPYVYVPAGLRKPGATRRIIVHDAVHNADGTRWCIMIADTKPGKPQEAEVVQLAEPLFLAYQ